MSYNSSRDQNSINQASNQYSINISFYPCISKSGNKIFGITVKFVKRGSANFFSSDLRVRSREQDQFSPKQQCLRVTLKYRTELFPNPLFPIPPSSSWFPMEPSASTLMTPPPRAGPSSRLLKRRSLMAPPPEPSPQGTKTPEVVNLSRSRYHGVSLLDATDLPLAEVTRPVYTYRPMQETGDRE